MVLDAAMIEFAAHGLHGGTVEAIAQRVGVSQPYLFHLFGTKKKLFLAAVSRGFDRTRSAFETAVAALPPEARGDKLSVLAAMGHAYADLLYDRTLLQLQLQAYAACEDLEVRALVREWFTGLQAYVADVAKADEAELAGFFGAGMLMNVGAAMDAAEIDESWARILCREGNA